MMHSLLARPIYQLGMAVRNPTIRRNYRFLKESERWSIQQLRGYQLEKLQSILRTAVERSPFYSQLYRQHGVDVASVKSLDDVKRLPIVEKPTLLNNVSQIQTRDISEPLFLSETSGSTGQALVFHRNRSWDGWVNASVFRGYSWHGVSPWERNGYLWGYDIAPGQRRKIRMLDLLQNRFRLFSYDRREMERFIGELRAAKYLNGYSSMIYELARLANELDIDLSHLKLVKGTSETIHEAYQRDAVRAFGKRIVSEYGSAEGGIIAFECPHGSLHINMETVIVEEINGEIVLTNLVSDSFPIIRYRLGDYVSLARDQSCQCGLNHEIITEVAGRVGEVIRGVAGSYPSLTLYYVFKNLALRTGLKLSYTAVQNEVGALDVTVDRSIDTDETAALRAEFDKYFKADLEVRIAVASERDNHRSKKRDFISHLQTN